MAKHSLFAASKKNLARAVLGATVVSTVLGVNAVAHAEALPHPAAHAAPVLADRSEDVRVKSEKEKITVTAQQVLALAKSQIGTSENSVGGGTPYQRWYSRSQRAAETIARDGGTRADYLNAAWCAMFVSWVGDKAGARSQIGWDAYTVAHAKWFKNNGRFGDVAKPGSVVFFSWSGSDRIRDINHVGFVEKDNGDGTITTIEGNTGRGRVEERVRPKSQVVGYGYPDYAA
ncbi:CHAP domain-containing protein [Nonomuraea maritima]|uniref:CHAP domain-containing protein n=1 Tax=Nonomuraea maritima TaxID=683260 RepID=A0A1G8WH03_9ACTN|nr:CHAP domain-containing protein [Nonomuraea maritima]SDJ76800.1 CHAP domain-containing protein [Nonomuraea maritima]